MSEYPLLLATLDQWFGEGLERAGAGVVPCTTGCTACCHGPFDISPADAAQVAAGLRALAPDVRAALIHDAREQVARYAELAPEWERPWNVAALDEEQFDRLAEALADLPCPALDQAGACRIYAHRPATCRLMGLALVTPEGEVLENACPIQSDFPEYESLAPTPFDLLRFELEAEEVDAQVTAAGWCITTVAGAALR
ncbi:MAG: YkgJ family cysteine cluster protein [Gemmatimonadota bacterium]